MPPRNLLIIALTTVVALACYSMAARNRYANLFAEAMDVVDRQSLRVVPRDELFVSAMNGMMDHKDLDEHSMFISGDMFQSFDEDMRQEFGGVGMYVEVDPETKQLCVIAPMPDTPAMEAGMKVGDQIVSVDGVPTLNMKRRESLKLLRGPVGKPVNLEVDRGGEILKKVVDRRVIPVASVHGDSRLPNGSWDFKLKEHPRIGYIRLLQFGEKSSDEIRAAIQKVGGEIDGLILDLRNNSGGLLDVAIEICDMVLPADLPIVRTLGREKKVVPNGEYFSTGAMELSPGVPMCVLVDRHSASASEIVAGCLQDHGRAVVIGEQSWGKGTVQNVIPIQRGQSALKLTTASYWRPSGKNIDRYDEISKQSKKWGVQPDPGFEVSLEEEEIFENLRNINIRELRTLVTAQELEFIRRVKRGQADQMREAALKAAVKAGAKATTDSSVPSEDESRDASEPHVDLPLQRAIDHLKSLLAKEVLIAA